VYPLDEVINCKFVQRLCLCALHTDRLNVAGTRTSRLLNVAGDLPLADRSINNATKAPDFVATKVGDENFVTILICLMTPSTDATHTVKQETSLVWVRGTLTR